MALRWPMRRPCAARCSDRQRGATRAMLTRTLIVSWFDLLSVDALKRRPEALRVGCAIAEEVLHEHRRDIASIAPSKCLVN